MRLAVSADHASLEFAYEIDGEWRNVGPVLDASILSDEAGGGEHCSFTHAFVGMFAFGAAAGGISADFRHFDYRGKETDRTPAQIGAGKRKSDNWLLGIGGPRYSCPAQAQLLRR